MRKWGKEWIKHTWRIFVRGFASVPMTMQEFQGNVTILGRTSLRYISCMWDWKAGKELTSTCCSLKQMWFWRQSVDCPPEGRVYHRYIEDIQVLLAVKIQLKKKRIHNQLKKHLQSYVFLSWISLTQQQGWWFEGTTSDVVCLVTLLPLEVTLPLVQQRTSWWRSDINSAFNYKTPVIPFTLPLVPSDLFR